MELCLDAGSTVELIHDDGRKLLWDVSEFDRTRLVDVNDVFRDINGYWSKLTPNRRNRIWEVYTKIHDSLNRITDPARLAQTLTGQVAELYAEMPLDEITHWVKFHGNVKIPTASLKLVHDPDDNNPGRTYLHSDYMGLVDLVIALRPMVPIWGEYIRCIKTESGSSYKVYVAVRLLNRSHLITSPPIERLRTYIECSIPYGNIEPSTILSGLGTAEMPDWLLSLVLVRRLAIGEIDALGDNGSIISNIFGFITNTLKDLGRKFGGTVREKHQEDVNIDDEGSLIESYKVKEEIAAGDIAAFSVYTENVVRMTHHIDPTVPMDIIGKCIANASKMQGLYIRRHHLALCQWVMDRAMSPGSIPCLNKTALLRVMASTQAVLWHWGFPELAAMVTAEEVKSDRDMFLAVDSRTRIPNELVEQLNVLYPHFDQSDKTSSQGRKNNVACIAIAALTKELTAFNWRVVAPAELLQRCQGIDNLNRIVVPMNVMEMLARLVLKIHQNKQENVVAAPQGVATITCI